MSINIKDKGTKKSSKVGKNILVGYTFSEKAIETMKRLNFQTRKTEKEHGALLFGDKNVNKIYLSDECVGTKSECRLLESSTTPKENFMGIFHTHKADLPIFSLDDLSNDVFINCLGASYAKKGRDLECLVPKEPLNADKIIRRRTELAILRGEKPKEGQIRKLWDIITEDYHIFNPEKYTDP